MSRITLVWTLCGLASVTSAQRNAIDIKLRLAGTTQWVRTLNVPDCEAPAHVEVGVFYERASGYGFSGSVHNVVTSNWSAADQVILLDRSDSAQHPDGRQGRFNFGSQRQAAYTTGADAGTLRIAAANNTQNIAAGGISVKQNTPAASGSLFDTGNHVLGFRFDVILAYRPPNIVHTWNFVTPANRILNYSIYETESSTSATNVSLNSLVLNPAQLNYVICPSPGALSALAFSTSLLLRRKRTT